MALLTLLTEAIKQWPHILRSLTLQWNTVGEPEVLRSRDRLGQTVELCRASNANLNILRFQQPERSS